MGAVAGWEAVRSGSDRHDDAARLAASLRDVVGPAHVLTAPDETDRYAIDWTRRFRGRTPVVVRPGSTGEVAEVVRRCAEAGAAIVPQGGNTGLVGGSVPLHGEVVLSTLRLAAIGDVDRVAGQLTAGAGATIEAVHAAAAAAGWAYGVDFGARGSATVGGTVATNAGGIHVLRYGDTRAQLLGLEAVLADGSVISHLGGLLKDNTGYHLPSLLCGSEGTLGVITRIRLRLVPRQAHRVTAMIGVADVAAALALVSMLRRRVPSLEAAELCLADGMALVGTVLGVAPPTSAPVVVLVECAARADPTDELAAALDAVLDAEVLVATDDRRRADLWRWRERHTESIATLGVVHKLDVTLPAPVLAEFVDRARSLVAARTPHAAVHVFGHLADGNLHVNVTGLGDDDDEAVDDALLRLVASFGGSISAEHGIGTLKAPWLGLSRTPAEIAAMRAIKAALDPAGLFNPAVLLPPVGRPPEPGSWPWL